MKRINKLQENTGLMVELLKKHNELLSQLLIGIVEMNKKELEPDRIVEILNKILSIILGVIKKAHLFWDDTKESSVST